MNVQSKIIQVMIFSCIAFLILIALVIAVVVIPPVQTDTSAYATPERAALAFWVSTVLHLLIATVLIFITVRLSRSLKSILVLVVLGILSILLALALYDAANAFQAHGPSLITATTFLFICAAIDLIIGVSLIIISILLKRIKNNN